MIRSAIMPVNNQLKEEVKVENTLKVIEYSDLYDNPDLQGTLNALLRGGYIKLHAVRGTCLIVSGNACIWKKSEVKEVLR